MANEMRNALVGDLPSESSVIFGPRNYTSRDMSKVGLWTIYSRLDRRSTDRRV